MAQATTPATTTTSVTSLTSATPTVSNSTVAVPPPPRLDVWAAYPEPIKSYSSAQIAILNNLVFRLSNAANQMTKGKYNFQSLRDRNFKVDPSEFTGPTKFLMGFFAKVFKLLLNNGIAFATQPIDSQLLARSITALMNSPELMGLANVNMTGPVANQQAGNSNIYQTIHDTLQQLQPTVPTRPA